MKFCWMRSHRVAGTTIRALKRHLGGYDSIIGMADYLDDFYVVKHEPLAPSQGSSPTQDPDLTPNPIPTPMAPMEPQISWYPTNHVNP